MSELQSIGITVLRNFRELYRQKWPKYCQEFNTLSTIIEFMKVEPKLKHITAYTLPDEEAKEIGLFLIMDRYQLLVGCLGYSFELLELALLQLNWKQGVLCTSIPSRYFATLAKVVQVKKLEIEFQHESNLYRLSRQQALQFSIEFPKGFQLKSLSEKDAQLIDREWPYSHEGSLYFLQRQIQHCSSMGLYEQQTHKLVAWCIRTQDGLLAALQVDNCYKRRGFGTLVVRALSQSIAALGEDITAEIYGGNIASSEMFAKLGFEIIDQCYWLNTLPEKGKFTWPKGQ